MALIICKKPSVTAQREAERPRRSLIQEDVAKGKRKSRGMKQTAETQQTRRGLGRYLAAGCCSE